MDDESQQLIRKFSDKARKPVKVGHSYLIAHKFTPEGEVVGEDNFDPKRDLSRLTRDDFRLLVALQEKKWDKAAACKELGLDQKKAERRLKKISYFEFEEKKSQALAAIVSPAFVAAKNVEGFYTDSLSDGQRDHLKELAKISGAYKPVTSVSVNVNAFVRPNLSPEQEKATREFFDTIVTQGDQ